MFSWHFGPNWRPAPPDRQCDLTAGIRHPAFGGQTGRTINEGNNVSKAKTSTGWDVTARLLAAILGGYAAAYAATAFLSVYLPLVRSDRVVFASLACFVVYTIAIIYAFAARSALRAWLVLAGVTVLMALAAYLPTDFGVRP